MNREAAQHGSDAPVPALKLQLEAIPENVTLVRQAVDGAVRHLGAHDALAADIKLAVSEACTNAVKHAYSENGARPLEIAVRSDATSVTVSTRDWGRWSDHMPGPEDDTGMGLQLMTALSTACSVRQAEDGTEIQMEFELQRDEADADA